MSAIRKQAELFFDACETGKGWEGCKDYCHPGATFSAQAGALAGIETLEGRAYRMDEGALDSDSRRQVRSEVLRR